MGAIGSSSCVLHAQRIIKISFIHSLRGSFVFADLCERCLGAITACCCLDFESHLCAEEATESLHVPACSCCTCASCLSTQESLCRAAARPAAGIPRRQDLHSGMLRCPVEGRNATPLPSPRPPLLSSLLDLNGPQSFSLAGENACRQAERSPLLPAQSAIHLATRYFCGGYENNVAHASFPSPPRCAADSGCGQGVPFADCPHAQILPGDVRVCAPCFCFFPS